jgi:hypothetical protein
LDPTKDKKKPHADPETEQREKEMSAKYAKIDEEEEKRLEEVKEGFKKADHIKRMY